MTKYTDDEIHDAIKFLWNVFPEGSSIPMITRWVNNNGDKRVITVLGVASVGDREVMNVAGYVATVLGEPFNHRHNGVTITGGGMDMQWDTARRLGEVLYGNPGAFNARTIS